MTNGDFVRVSLATNGDFVWVSLATNGDLYWSCVYIEYVFIGLEL